MTALLAVLISGVLLNQMDQPMSNAHLVFISSTGKFIEVATDKSGKFQVQLAPGTYRYMGESIKVDKSTPKLRLHQRTLMPTPSDEPHREGDFPKPEPHVIEVIQKTQRDIMRVPLDLSLNPLATR